MCGEQILDKNCDLNHDVEVICEGQDRPISKKDVCFTSDFIKAEGYSEKDIRKMKYFDFFSDKSYSEEYIQKIKNSSTDISKSILEFSTKTYSLEKKS